MSNDEYIFIGILGRSVGTNGALNLTSWSSFPERFEEMESFFLTKEKAVPQTVQVESVEIGTKKIVVKLKGYDNIESANKLNGYRITIPKSERVELPEGQYYIDDLQGCQVYETNGNLLGKFMDVWDMGPNEIYVVDYHGKELLIPAVDEFIKEIDMTNKKVVVELLDGMLPTDDEE